VTVLVLTDRAQARRPLREVIAAAVDGGARSVVLREKDLPRPERIELAEALRAILEPVGGRLIVAGPDPLGGNAVHLAAADPAPDGVGYVGRSCHDADELSRLSTEDYVIVSPVFPTASKPGYGPPLGLYGLAALASRTGKPVFGLGGLDSPAHAIACLAAGAAGVAVMGAVMRAADPTAVVADFVAEVGA
jgi:thiamine-phosphate pyrophosphorylase